jgi:hypothetical protein
MPVRAAVASRRPDRLPDERTEIGHSHGEGSIFGIAIQGDTRFVRVNRV